MNGIITNMNKKNKKKQNIILNKTASLNTINTHKSSSESLSTTRFIAVDILRGFTVLLMIIFHTIYDFALFKIISIPRIFETAWFYFPRLIVCLFLICVGISLSIEHYNKIMWRKFFFRLSKIIFFATTISLVTYFLFPNRWIYFGTLHCIAITSIMSLPFLKLPKTALWLGIIIFSFDLFFKLRVPWIMLKHLSMDYIPPFPWISAALFGIFLFHKNIHKFKLPQSNSLIFLGQNSLFIYIIHQPLIYSIALLVSKY